MQQNKKYRMVGLFVVVGFLCFIGIILNYVSQNFIMNKNDLVVMYFEESIQGLSVGSAVVLQGVEIGQVNKIKLVPDLQDGTFKTPVYVLFDKQKISSYRCHDHMNNRQILKYLIGKGLRAQLISANYLTGQLMIQLSMDPGQPIILHGNEQYLEIPTELSAFAKFSKDLKQIPLHESLIRLGNVLVDLDNNLPSILKNISQITQKVNHMMNHQTGGLSDTIKNLNTTLEEITKASLAIKNLTDYLERHPEAIIRGKEK